MGVESLLHLQSNTNDSDLLSDFFDRDKLRTMYHFYCKSAGRLSHINIKLLAVNFADPVKLAQDRLHPFLSGWGAQFNDAKS